MNNFMPSHRPNTRSVPAEDFSLNFEEIKVSYAGSGPHDDKWIDVLSVGW